MWDLPRLGIEPVSPALAGGFLTTAPPEKSQINFLKCDFYNRPPSVRHRSDYLLNNLVICLQPQFGPICIYFASHLIWKFTCVCVSMSMCVCMCARESVCAVSSVRLRVCICKREVEKVGRQTDRKEREEKEWEKDRVRERELGDWENAFLTDRLQQLLTLQV